MSWFEDHWEMLVAFGGIAMTSLKGFLHLRDRVNENQRNHEVLAKEHNELQNTVKELVNEFRADLKEVHTRVTESAKSTSRIEGMLTGRHRS